MKRRVFTSIFSIVWFITASNPVYPADSISWFPLAVGNEWHYQSENFTQTAVISDTIQRRGTVYYEYLVGEHEMHYYFRSADDRLYLWHAPDSTEILIYDFTAAVGDTWKLPEAFACDLGKAISLEERELTVETSADTFFNCVRFVHQPACFDAGRLETWIAPGIGPVRYREDNFAGAQTYQLAAVNRPTRTDEFLFPSIPHTVHLRQNYPNPFNATTMIQYVLPEASPVQLTILDLRGNLVSTLVAGREPAGRYSVRWDGRNTSGQSVSTGIYIYRLSTPEAVRTGKMVLVK